jgi:hypothetical protein
MEIQLFWNTEIVNLFIFICDYLTALLEVYTP